VGAAAALVASCQVSGWCRRDGGRHNSAPLVQADLLYQVDDVRGLTPSTPAVDPAARGSRKGRHHDEPAVGELIVADHRVTVVVRFARTAETLEHRVVATGPYTISPFFRKIAMRVLTI